MPRPSTRNPEAFANECEGCSLTFKEVRRSRHDYRYCVECDRADTTVTLDTEAAKSVDTLAKENFQKHYDRKTEALKKLRADLSPVLGLPVTMNHIRLIESIKAEHFKPGGRLDTAAFDLNAVNKIIRLKDPTALTPEERTAVREWLLKLKAEREKTDAKKQNRTSR